MEIEDFVHKSFSLAWYVTLKVDLLKFPLCPEFSSTLTKLVSRMQSAPFVFDF